MGLFDMKKLKDAVQSATVTAASTVRDAADAAATAAGEGKLPDVKLPEVKLPDVKLPERVTNLVDRARPDATTTDVPEQGLSGRDALSVFYYLMSADGELAEAELVRFHEMCAELGQTFAEQTDSIVAHCNARLDANVSRVPLVSVMTCVDEILYTTPASNDESADEMLIVSPKQLLWNMLAVCYSDGSIDDTEREVVKHVGKYYGVSDVIVRELEHAALTLVELDREECWIKTTNRPYLVIEAQVAEIGERKSAVLEGVQALLTL